MYNFYVTIDLNCNFVLGKIVPFSITAISLVTKMVQQCETLAKLKEEIEAAGDKLVVIDFFATW